MMKTGKTPRTATTSSDSSTATRGATPATTPTTPTTAARAGERRGSGRQGSLLGGFDFTDLSALTPTAMGVTPPTTAAEQEVFRRIQIIDRAIAAVDELSQILPASAADEGALQAARAQWFGKAPQLCDATASLIQHNDERFEGTPLSANLIRLELLEAGRLDYLRRQLTDQGDSLGRTLTLRRGDVMGRCATALQHMEAPLSQPFLPEPERQAIERAASPVRQLMEERTQDRLRTQLKNERLVAGVAAELAAQREAATEPAPQTTPAPAATRAPLRAPAAPVSTAPRSARAGRAELSRGRTSAARKPAKRTPKTPTGRRGR